MKSVRCALGGVIAGGVMLAAGCVGTALGDVPGVQLPGLPMKGVSPAAAPPAALQAAVGHSPATLAAPSSSGPQSELQASDGTPGDGLGYSVAVDSLGDEAIVGAPNRNGAEGATYVFVRQGAKWVQQSELAPSDGAPDDDFGSAVSVNALGDVAIVGAYDHNLGEGAAYVFVRQGAKWVQQSELQPSDGAPGDDFGYSVALNALGNEASAGAPSHNDAEGAAYVFVRQGSGWNQQSELQPSDGASGDGFGLSVALNSLGGEAIVGSPEHNVFVGSAYVFVHQSSGWVQQSELQPSDGAFGDLFGYGVATDALGDDALIGSIGHNGAVGAAYVFAERSGGWAQQQELSASDGAAGDGFGVSVALNALGNEGLVGAYAHNDAEGAAYVFSRRSTAWSQQQELSPSGGAAGDAFGFSAALDALGDEAVVGAPRHNLIKGAAYVFGGV